MRCTQQRGRRRTQTAPERFSTRFPRSCERSAAPRKPWLQNTRTRLCREIATPQYEARARNATTQRAFVPRGRFLIILQPSSPPPPKSAANGILPQRAAGLAPSESRASSILLQGAGLLGVGVDQAGQPNSDGAYRCLFYPTYSAICVACCRILSPVRNF